MKDREEVHDSLLATNDAKRDEEAKLVALNDVIVEALDKIETLENNVDILDGTGDDVMVRYGYIDLCLDVGCSVEGCSTAHLQVLNV
ncbi:hypothetical protein Tco_1334247 [Tanacetum coccineum]